jgi:adenylate cyclase
VAIEIERKFLVTSDSWKPADRVHHIEQGYLSSGSPASVRVRLQDDVATLTIKSERAGLVRDEFEYPIPLAEAEQLLRLCSLPPIVKKRHELVYAGKLWQIDVFEGRHAGLVMAEIELTHERESFERPTWLGREVTSDPRYRNSALIETGFDANFDPAPQRMALARN